MGKRALENRIQELKEIEAQKAALDERAEKLKEEIKKDMEAKGAEEIKAGNFIVRWKQIVSNRFDTKAFQAEHKALYEKYLRQTRSKRGLPWHEKRSKYLLYEGGIYSTKKSFLL